MSASPGLQELLDPRLSRGYGGRFYGVYAALVVDVVDPDGQGRVRVRLPWSPDAEGAAYEAWARLATLMAGAGRGSWFIPDVDDEVLVSFEAGDPRRPYVLGALWNGVDDPPESMDGAGRNPLKTLKSRNGVTVTMEDQDGRERLTLETPAGQKVELRDGPGVLELRDQNGNVITLEASGVTVSSALKIKVEAGAEVEVTAGQVTVNAAMTKFSGIVQTPTLIASSVVGSSYTPGAGNIW